MRSTAAILLLLAAPAFGQADFTRSELVGPASVRERDVARFTLTVRNTGDARPSYQQLSIRLPPLGLRAETPPELRFDPAERTLEGGLDLGPGESREIRFGLLAAPDSDGTLLSPMASIRAEPGGTVLHASTEVVARRDPAELVPIGGGLNLTRAGLWVLGFLVGAPLALALLTLLALALARRRSAARRLPLASLLSRGVMLLIAAGFLAFFVALARDDLRILREYREASCEVLDSSFHAQSVTSGTRATRSTSTTYQPIVAVRFRSAAGDVFGAGYDGPSRLRVGGASRLEAELAAFSVGSLHPCWYDPADPARVVLRRGPGGAYFFALLPLGLGLLAAASWWRLVR